MKIAILGTRGIPKNYGGFEQCAEYLSIGLVQKGHEVTVYNPNFHPYEESSYQGVKIIKKPSPQRIVGNSAANFIYDFLLAYGLPKSSINRLKKGDYNQSKIDGEIIWITNFFVLNSKNPSKY